MSGNQKTVGPDLTAGIAMADVPDGGMIGGHVGDDNVLVARRGDELFALSAKCTHYGGPLHQGLVAGDTVRCPWHHACFSLRSGEALAAPALNPVSCWRVEVDGDRVFVRERVKSSPPRRQPQQSPESVVIIGGGAAGEAAAEMLRREGYAGPVTILSDDAAPPCDRPNLSKDYLAGTAQASWIPLRGDKFYQEHDIDLRLNTRVEAIDPAASSVKLADGGNLNYGALLLATGAEPVRLKIPGTDLPHVRYLRTLADSEAIIGAVEGGAKRVVVIGASFIGLEVAASLRNRDVEVHVVAPEARPLERVMGAALGDFVRTLHESKGVNFYLEQTATAFEADHVTLQNGEQLAADLVVVGVGVRPRTALAEAAGLEVDNGVLVDEHLRTSAANVYAAGDIARWPDRRSGERIRVEHWVVAQRQGQVAARNILGAHEAYTAPPFFWSQHYDAGINYVGHARQWDRIETDGDAQNYDFTARFIGGDKTLAVATIYRDVESLQTELDMENEAKEAG
ncbi:MAG TPA: FAD-dependent oxidoreductase [Gammaproteobacteria bacterium]|nr:FAD-dependent oxidoreductase [Gammaproteobacteria bacterium]